MRVSAKLKINFTFPGTNCVPMIGKAMTIAATEVRTFPRQGRRVTTGWAKLVISVLFTASVTALEAWLRAPVRPVLDVYLGTVLGCASSIAARVILLMAILAPECTQGV